MPRNAGAAARWALSLVLLTLSSQAFQARTRCAGRRPQGRLFSRCQSPDVSRSAAELRSQGFAVLPDVCVGGTLAAQVAAQASARLETLLAAVERAGTMPRATAPPHHLTTAPS